MTPSHALDDVVLVKVVDHVATVTLNRPEKLNAITVQLAERLQESLVMLGGRDDVRVIVIRGAGHNLSAGGDFDEVRTLREAGASELARLFDFFGKALESISKVPQPVIVVVEGVAMAGGFELVQAADIVLAHEDAKVRDTHIRFGWIPGGGSTQRLPRLVGRQRAMAHLLSGETWTAADLLVLGLAHRVLTTAGFEHELDVFVSGLASRDSQAVRLIKSLVNRSVQAPLEDGLAFERRTVIDFIAGEAGEKAFARFAHRDSAEAPASPFTSQSP